MYSLSSPTLIGICPSFELGLYVESRDIEKGRTRLVDSLNTMHPINSGTEYNCVKYPLFVSFSVPSFAVASLRYSIVSDCFVCVSISAKLIVLSKLNSSLKSCV